MSPPGDGELSTCGLARALGLDPALVRRALRKGMPKDVAGAKAWRLAFVRHRRGRDENSVSAAEPAARPPQVVPLGLITGLEPDKPEDLNASLERLRRLERSTSQAIERLLKEGKTSEAIALRREHAALLRALFDSSAKLLKLEEKRGKLISIDTALQMITEALSPGIMMLRRLPELGRDEQERQRLETFMNAVLTEIRCGAAQGLEKSSASTCI